MKFFVLAEILFMQKEKAKLNSGRALKNSFLAKLLCQWKGNETLLCT